VSDPLPEAAALVVGLGNPGPRYARTLHNAGFLAVEELARRSGAGAFVRSGQSLLACGRAGGRAVVLVKPLTFMNHSGLALAELPAEAQTELLVVHDDLDLPFGSVRLKAGGGDGGHRGVRSIAGTLGHGRFTRVRVGIGRGAPELDAAQYVLEPLEEARFGLLLEAAASAADALELCLQGGIVPAMNQFNRRKPAALASGEGGLAVDTDGLCR
jgi:peptidyl-tRNA hydrolase, PTH1 family